MKAWKLLVFTPNLFFAVGSAFGGGYSNPYIGTASLAMGATGVASADDPSAIYFNPAALTWLEGNQVLLSPSLFNVDSDYRRNPGTTTVTSDKPVWTGFAGFSTDLNRSDLVIAAGVYTPFGLKLQWPEDGPQRYSATRSELKTVFFTPSIAYRVTERLSVGAGVSLIWSGAELRNKTNPFPSDPANPLFMNPAYDIDVRVAGDDFDVGADIGLLYKIHDGLTWGFLYVPEVGLEFDGEFTATIPPTLQPQFQGMEEITDHGTLALTLPHQLRTGIFWQGTERLGLSFDFNWARWSSLEALTFDFDNATPLTTEDTVLPRDWKDSFDLHLGAEYRIRTGLVIRGGYLFDRTPVPDRTMDPILPQADKNVFTVGAGYRLNALSFDLAFAQVIDQDRTITNSILPYPTNGSYETTAQILAFSSGYSF